MLSDCGALAIRAPMTLRGSWQELLTARRPRLEHPMGEAGARYLQRGKRVFHGGVAGTTI